MPISYKVPRSDPMTSAKKHELAQLLLVIVFRVGASAAISVAAAAHDVDSFGYPAFDATTTEGFLAVNKDLVMSPASQLFGNVVRDRYSGELNRTEGFLLRSRAVDFWRAGAGGFIAREASFNTSFTLTVPVAFVVLKDVHPPPSVIGGIRGFANYSDSGAAGPTTRNASGSLAAVEAGPVRSYGPDNPAVGLNVTVTPNGGTAAAAARTVWIEYNAAASRLSVYVAGVGEARPATALLDARLLLAGLRTTQTGLVGFFASTVQEILVGVRDWNLTVDRLGGQCDSSGGGGWNKGISWSVILLAVLGSVAAMA